MDGGEGSGPRELCAPRVGSGSAGVLSGNGLELRSVDGCCDVLSVWVQADVWLLPDVGGDALVCVEAGRRNRSRVRWQGWHPALVEAVVSSQARGLA